MFGGIFRGVSRMSFKIPPRIPPETGVWLAFRWHGVTQEKTRKALRCAGFWVFLLRGGIENWPRHQESKSRLETTELKGFATAAFWDTPKSTPSARRGPDCRRVEWITSSRARRRCRRRSSGAPAFQRRASRCRGREAARTSADQVRQQRERLLRSAACGRLRAESACAAWCSSRRPRKPQTARPRRRCVSDRAARAGGSRGTSVS